MDKINKRVFSLYDVEQFLKDAGAERVTERAVISLERELHDMVKGLVEEAELYANYAGRSRLISVADINLARSSGSKNRVITYKGKRAGANKRNSKIKRSSAMKEVLDHSRINLIEAQNIS